MIKDLAGVPIAMMVSKIFKETKFAMVFVCINSVIRDLAQPFIDQAAEKFASPESIFLTVDVGDRPL